MLILGSLSPKFLNQPNYKGTIEVHFFLINFFFIFCQALRSPTKLLEQAKSILDGGSELLNPNFPSDVASEDNCGPISEKLKENPPERRPALGRKRARFSLKPDSRYKEQHMMSMYTLLHKLLSLRNKS